MGEIKKTYATLIISAFAFVMALVWNDAIQEILSPIILENGIYQMILTAIIVTLISLGVIWFIGRTFEKEKEKCLQEGGTWYDNSCEKKG